jgi:hypothetical protein
MISRATLNVGGFGALVGGAATAAQVIPKVKKNEMSAQDATREVLKEAAGTGLATAAGAAVVGSVGMGGILSLLAMFGVATGAKYLWNSAMNKPALAEAQSPPPAKAKKSAK